MFPVMNHAAESSAITASLHHSPLVHGPLDLLAEHEGKDPFPGFPLLLGGQIPRRSAAPTRRDETPFDENVAGLCYCGDES
jgi:hypothetical protein